MLLSRIEYQLVDGSTWPLELVFPDHQLNVTRALSEAIMSLSMPGRPSVKVELLETAQMQASYARNLLEKGADHGGVREGIDGILNLFRKVKGQYNSKANISNACGDALLGGN